MKVRHGFVSNSSASSFVIDSSKLSKIQIKMIFDYGTVASENGFDSDANGWEVVYNSKQPQYIELSTIIDNFDMLGYVQKVVKIPDNCIYNLYEQYSKSDRFEWIEGLIEHPYN